MTPGENVVTQLVTNLIVNCPLFLALVVGVAAFVRNSRPARCLALIGFAAGGGDVYWFATHGEYFD